MKKACFVIAPIGEPKSPARIRSDKILTYIIQPAASQCDYVASRSDQDAQPGLITSQIIQHLIDDPLVIADLTDHNPNVFYELAIRHAVRKPVVQMIEKGQEIPFDVSPLRTIKVDHTDLESAHNATEEIVNQIRSVEKDPSNVDTPISSAIDLQSLRRSGNPQEKSNAQILTLLEGLFQKMDQMAERVRNNSIPTIQAPGTSTGYTPSYAYTPSPYVTAANLSSQNYKPSDMVYMQSRQQFSTVPGAPYAFTPPIYRPVGTPDTVAPRGDADEKEKKEKKQESSS